MSTEIDKRIVEMQFNNKDFEKNIQQSLSTIDKLKLALNFDGGKGFDQLTKAADKMNLSNVGKQIDVIQAKFTALQIAGITTVQEITKAFLNFGKNIWSSTFGQIRSGGMSRALKIEQAEFKMKALAKNMYDASMEADVLEGKINGLMQAMGTAIDNAVTGTAYGYDAAADVASQLMASGIRDAERMERYLKGVAGAAAMTGNSFEQIGHVFTTIASNGKLMTMQLRQFSTYGMNLSATLAKQLGKTEAQINQMVTDGQISFEQFADALADAYGDAAQKADDTFAGVTTNIKAQLSRLGQRFAVPFIQNAIPFLKEVKGAIKAISAALAPMADRFNKSFGYLANWAKETMQGKYFKNIEVFFRAIENVAYGLVVVLHTLYNAFKRVFPKSLTSVLYDISKGFLELSVNILPTKEGLDGLENVFVAILIPLKTFLNMMKNVAKILSPAISLIFNLANAMFSLFSFFTPVINMILAFISESKIVDRAITIISNSIFFIINGIKLLGTALVLLINYLYQAGYFEDFANLLLTIGSTVVNVALNIGSYLIPVVQTLFGVIVMIAEVIIAYAPMIFDYVIGFFENAIPYIEKLVNLVKNGGIAKGILGIANSVKALFSSFVNKGKDKSDIIEKLTDKENLSTLDLIKEKLLVIYEVIKDNLSELTASKVIFTSFGVVMVMLIFSFIGLSNAITRFIMTVRQVPFVFTRINQTMKAFNKYIAPSALILSFAVAIGVLALSLEKISKIPANDLRRSAIVLGIFGAALAAFLYVLQKSSMLITDENKIVKPLQPMGGALLSVAVSVLVLAEALKVMKSALDDSNNLLPAFGMILGFLGSMVGVAIALAKFAPALNISALSMLGFAASVYILAQAFKSLSKLDEISNEGALDQLIAIVLSLGIAMSATAKATAGTALAIFTFSVSLAIILGSVAMFARLPWKDMEDGIYHATFIFLMFIPLIKTIGKANRLSNVNAAGNINIASGMASMLLGMTVFVLGVAAFCKIVSTIEGPQLAGAIVALFAVMAFMTIATGILLGVNRAVSVAQVQAVQAGGYLSTMTPKIVEIGLLLMTMSASVILMGIAAKVMSNVPWWGIVEAIVMFGVVSGAMAGLMLASESIKDVSVKPVLGMIGAIIAIMGSLALLTFAAKEDPTALMIAAGAIFVVMSALALVMAAMKGFSRPSRELNTNVANATDEILAMMAILGVVALIVAIVSRNVNELEDMVDFNNSIALLTFAMIIIAGGAAATLKIMSKIKMDPTEERKMWSLVGMYSSIVSSIMVIAGALFVLSKIPSEKLAQSVVTGLGIAAFIITLFTVISIMVSNTSLAPSVDPNALLSLAGSVAIMSSVFLVIAGALMAISTIDIPNLIASSIAMGLLFAEVAGALSILATISQNNLDNSATDIALTFAGMGAGLLLIAAAFAAIKASGIDSDEIVAYAGALALIFGIMATAVTVISIFGQALSAAVPFIAAFAAAFFSFGVTAGGLGVLFLSLCEVFETFSNATEKSVNKVVDNFLTFAKRIPEIIVTLAGVIMESGPAIGLAVSSVFVSIFTGIATAIANSITAILESLNLVLMAVVNWLNSEETIEIIRMGTYGLGKALMEGIVQGAFDYINDNPKVEAFFDKVFGAFDYKRQFDYLAKPFAQRADALNYFEIFADNLKEAADAEFYERADDFADNGYFVLECFNQGIEKGYWTTEEAAELMAEAGLDGLDFALNRPDFKGDMNAMGEYFVEGLNKGIESGYYTTEQATAILAKYALEGYADKLKIHSPSLEMIKMGEFTIAGIIEGIKNGEYSLMEVLSAVAESGVGAFSSIFTTENLLANAGILGGNMKTLQDFRNQGATSHYDYETGDQIFTWQEAGFKSLDEYAQHYYDEYVDSAGFNLLEDLLGGFKVDDVFTDLDLSGMTDLNDTLEETSEEADKAKERLDKLKDSLMSTMDIFTEFNRETNITAKDVFKTYMGQIEGVSDWTNMLNELAQRGLNVDILHQLEEEGPKSFEKVSAIYMMTSNELAMLNAMYKDSFDLADKAIDSIEESAENIEALTLADLQQEVKETVMSFENFDDEVAGVLTQLEDLQKEGNVNLLMRPTINTEELNKAGYDAGDGFATMFTETVSNETEDIAMNFTPIMVDPKTGKYLGVMDPDEFHNYCKDVVGGVRKDDLNLKVGMTFKGEKAIDQAVEAAETIHKLHEQLGEEWGEDMWSQINVQEVTKEFTDDIAEGIEDGIPDIRNAMTNYGKSAIESLRRQLKFDEALDKVRDFKKEYAKSLKDSLNIFDDVEEMEEISTTKLLDNMEENAKRVGGWSYNLRKMIKMGFSEELVEEMRNLGPESADKVDAFVRMSADEVSIANRYFADAIALPDQLADNLITSYAEAGFGTSLGFSEGIDPEVANDVMTALASNTLTALETALEINEDHISEKALFEGIGTTEGFAEGIKDEDSLKNVENAAKEAAGRAISGLSNSISTDKAIDKAKTKFVDFAKEFGKTASTIVGSVYSSIFNNSETELTSFNDHQADIMQIRENMMDQIASEFYNIGSSFTPNGLYQPVIRPVIDLTDVNNGFVALDEKIKNNTFSISGTIDTAHASVMTSLSNGIESAIIDGFSRLDVNGIKNEIKDMKNELFTLKSSFSGIKVIMDTGALVGEIATPLDNLLGSKVVKQKRGRM